MRIYDQYHNCGGSSILLKEASFGSFLIVYCVRFECTRLHFAVFGGCVGALVWQVRDWLQYAWSACWLLTFFSYFGDMHPTSISLDTLRLKLVFSGTFAGQHTGFNAIVKISKTSSDPIKVCTASNFDFRLRPRPGRWRSGKCFPYDHWHNGSDWIMSHCYACRHDHCTGGDQTKQENTKGIARRAQKPR